MDGSTAPSVGLFFASQTGTAEETAWELAREGRRKGYAMEPRAMDEISLEQLRKIRTAVFIVSTTGQGVAHVVDPPNVYDLVGWPGDPPLNMRKLWQELLQASLPATLLQGLSFAVFGLGDRRYREFNYAARKLHGRLQNLGADPWSEGMWAALAEKISPGQPDEDVDLRYEVDELGEIQNGEAHDVLDLTEDGSFWADLLDKGSLCTASHASDIQDVWNIQIRLPPKQRYVAGDVLVVWPRTEEQLVKRFVVETLERSLTESVRIRPRSRSAACPFPSRPLTLQEMFSRYIDVTAVPSRHFFHVQPGCKVSQF
eukprot:g16481.t1